MNKIHRELSYQHYILYHGKVTSALLSFLNRNKIYIPCLEVAVTTRCTLCCEKCSNLMQYYEHPYNVDINRLLEDIDVICRAVDGIDCLRIIGGEPFIWEYLLLFLKQIVDNTKIRNILIITNGTVCISDDILDVLSNNKKCKVSVSNYKDKSRTLKFLIKKFEEYNVKYSVNEVVWRDKADVSNKNKDEKILELAYKKCPNKFFSLLNGELHMCPRSSHGTDLGIVEKRECDYIVLSQYVDKKSELRKKFMSIFQQHYIAACNYCDEDIVDSLPIIETAKQCKKTEALMQLTKYIERGKKE